ncbi:MAG TPA: AAA family ATPase, partial [Phycisphaerae bacterium]|nr:AAA family ATPase [Phycisphaerae bacterium]
MTESARCRSCGSEFAEAARYCSQCGARVDDRLPSDPNSGGARLFCERRQLTVMFVDLVGSTKLSFDLDPEDFTSAVSAYRDVCVRVVRHWRGYVSRYVGDGVLICFGYPHASEDDALRAVAAAWELARDIPEVSLSKSTAARSSTLPRLRARVSLHTGLAVVGDVVGRDSAESHDILGAAPNIAARLQALAGPGEVVISEATAALLPPTIQLRPLEPISHRPEMAAVGAFAVTHMPIGLIRRRPISLGTFVGRNALLESILLELGTEREQVPAILVCGEPGVGKSRLVHEIITKNAARSIKWIEVACSAYGLMSPLHPFKTWLDESDAEDEAISSTPEASGDAPDGPTSPFDRRRQTFGKLQASLLAHAPNVGLLVEDLHWADSTTLEFLAELVSATEPSRFALLMTSRDQLSHPVSILQQLRVETLGRLLPGDSAELARELSGGKSLSAFELAEIVGHADGIPLYIEEFVRAISQYRSAAIDPNRDHIPVTLRDSL